MINCMINYVSARALNLHSIGMVLLCLSITKYLDFDGAFYVPQANRWHSDEL